MRVCFVCMGNICRSPTAEIVFRSMLADAGLADEVQASSAGTTGYHAGEPCDARAAAALHARGYDPAGHRARRFEPGWFADHDLVVAVDAATRDALQRLAPGEPVPLLRAYDPAAVAAGDLDVPDPYYGGPHGFERVLEMVERACAGLVAEVRAQVAR